MSKTLDEILEDLADYHEHRHDPLWVQANGEYNKENAKQAIYEFFRNNPGELLKPLDSVPIAGYDGRYEVTRDGRVWSSPTQKYPYGHWLNQTQHKQGYVAVKLNTGGSSKYVLVHRIVAQTFIPNPNNFLQVNHMNGIKTDNRNENLEWCTAKHNSNHAVSTGLRKSWNSKSMSRKLTEEDVRDIRMFRGAGIKVSDIARVYPVGVHTISNVINRVTWRNTV